MKEKGEIRTEPNNHQMGKECAHANGLDGDAGIFIRGLGRLNRRNNDYVKEIIEYIVQNEERIVKAGCDIPPEYGEDADFKQELCFNQVFGQEVSSESEWSLGSDTESLGFSSADNYKDAKEELNPPVKKAAPLEEVKNFQPVEEEKQAQPSTIKTENDSTLLKVQGLELNEINWFRMIIDEHFKFGGETDDEHLIYMLNKLLEIILSSKTNEEIQNEMLELVGFDQLEMMRELIEHRKHISVYCEKAMKFPSQDMSKKKKTKKKRKNKNKEQSSESFFSNIDLLRELVN